MASSRLIVLLAVTAAAITMLVLSVSSCQNNGGGAGSGNAHGGSSSRNTERVVIGGQNFDLELAVDDASRAQGLMHRTSIDEHGGMLFIFPDSEVKQQSFWMKNCPVDIDLIFLDRTGRITALHRMKAQPPQGPEESEAAYEARLRQRMYPSAYPAQFAIELRSGWLDQLNLKVEDRIDLDVARLKALAR